MERFKDESVRVLFQNDTLVAGCTVLKHGKGKTEAESDVYVLIDTVNDIRRYYLGSVIARAAQREITENKATFQTLSTNFNGRSLGEMVAFLEKNHVAPKPSALSPVKEAVAAVA